METENKPQDFLRQLVTADIAAGKHGGRVQTRFPPEPNGYLHIGHAKAICLDFGIAEEFGGTCYLRFDDTNPEKEELRYVEAIKEDVRWLGFDWENRLAHASDYFEQFHDYAVHLIEAGKAYVDSLSAEEIRAYRGTFTEPGRESPYRDRSIAENLELFAAMRRGEFEEGQHVLRARIDMASPNMNLRDPTLYRIRKIAHQRTGDAWCIYPMYDFAHTLSDEREGTTHSFCTLEFEDHRPLYEWFLDNLPVRNRPEQTEFSRFNLMFTIMSKRKLSRLVDEGHVEGWDDPRMPTLSGMRRRGYTSAAIREFVGRIGVTKKDNLIELGALETCVREDLNASAPRRFGVLRPLKVIIENYPEDGEEWLPAANHPNRPEMGSRQVPLSREIYIERDDFMEDPPRKYRRLRPGGEVRLRYAYIVKCEEVIKDASGEVVELRCSYDPLTRSGMEQAKRKVRGTIHWVSARHALRREVRLYDRLFTTADPDQGPGDFLQHLNSNSLEVLEAVLEPALAAASPEERYQFERLGYFTLDPVVHAAGRTVFLRTITLSDSWAKIEQQALREAAAAR